MPAPVAVTDRRICVLGVDPAAAGATGYGVIESDGRSCRTLRFGALRAARVARGEPLAHLREVHALVAALIEEFAPDSVAVEAVFAALNMKTALRLSEVRGVVLLAAAQAGIPCFTYSPRAVKAAVTGYGQAGKDQVQQMVRARLRMTEWPEPPDAADALAVALCHVQVAEARVPAAAAQVAPGRWPRRNRVRLPRIHSLR